jgi:ABC-2 type transport system permease protein
VAGAALLLAVAGVAAGLGYGLRTGSPGPEVTRLLGAALVQLPAALTVAGAAVALFGLAPRACVAGAWSVLAVVVVIVLFGQVLRLSGWLTGISPFAHVPKLPGAAVTLSTTGAPLLWLGLAALALTAGGLAGLRRRDIG